MSSTVEREGTEPGDPAPSPIQPYPSRPGPARPYPTQVNTGRPMIVVRGPRHSGRVERRTVMVCLILAALSMAMLIASLATGDFPIAVRDVVATLVGQGTDKYELIVLEWRLPRALIALILGGALGMSGAIFQSLTRNPLGSPDIIGFNTGAYTGALIAIIIIGGGYLTVAAGALVGGLVTAAVVYVLAYRKGMQGFRLIIVGIAVSAMLGSFNTWLILRADLEVAMAAAVWGAGSLSGISWAQATPAVVICLILGLIALAGDFSGRQLELGDDAASALGTRTQGSRLVQTVVGVALTASVTAVAGPIGFVALAAPQLARRLTKASGTGLIPAALMGATLLAASDWIAQHALPGITLPVGAVTVSLGGAYFIWLLIAEAKK